MRKIASALLSLMISLQAIPLMTSSEDGKIIMGIVWASEMNSEPIGIAVGDVNGDGEKEIAISCINDGILLLNSSGGVLWGYTVINGTKCLPLIVDVDGDGILDVGLGGGDNYAYFLDGKRNLIWKISTAGQITAMSSGDIDGNGINNVLITSTDNNIYSVEGGKILWLFTGMSDFVQSPVVGDVDGDGTLDIIAIGEDTNVYMLNSGGFNVWSIKMSSTSKYHAALADLNGSGSVSIIYSSMGNIYYANMRGKVFDMINLTLENITGISCGDLDRNGIVEIYATSTDGKIYCVEDRKIKWKFQMSSSITQPSALFSSGSEGFIVVGDDSGNIKVLSAWGTVMNEFTLPMGISSPPVVSDINGDGIAEIIIGSFDNHVYCLRLNTHANIEWRTDGKDASRTSNIDSGKDGSLPGKLDWISGGDMIPSYMAVRYFAENDMSRIFVPTGNKTLALKGNDGGVLWETESTDEIITGGVCADLEGDGKQEILISTSDGILSCLNGVTGDVIWKVSIEANSCPSVCDLDGDGKKEILVGATAEVKVLNADGKFIWGIPMDTFVSTSPSIVDIDGDLSPEIIAITDSGTIYVISSKTKKEMWHDNTADAKVMPPTFGDVDGDNIIDIIYATSDDKIRVLSGMHGDTIWEKTLIGTIKSSPIVADADHDGYWDIIVPTTAKTYAIGGVTAATLWTIDVPSYHVAACDIGSDHLYEILIGYDNGILCILPGGKIWWRYETASRVITNILVADVDGDGVMEAIFGCDDNMIYSISCGRENNVWEEQWHDYHHDNRRSGNIFTYMGDFLPDIEVSEISTKIYPNTFHSDDKINITTYVFNKGGSIAEMISLSLYINDDRKDVVMVPQLLPGGFANVTFSFIIPGGIAKIKIIVDENNEILESNEDNNAIKMLIPVNYRPIADAGEDVKTVPNFPIIFDASASTDRDGKIISYMWDFGDGMNGIGKVVTHSYKNSGNYLVSLVVTDDKGAMSKDVVNVTVNSPPIIVKKNPENDVEMREEMNITFSVIAHDPEGDDLIYEWLKDGIFVSNASEYTYYPSYYDDGKHKIVCTISDGILSTEVVWNVTVKDSVPPIKSWKPVEESITCTNMERIVFEIETTQKSTIEWYIDNSSLLGINNEKMSIFISNLSEGEHYVSVFANFSGHLWKHIWILKIIKKNIHPVITSYIPHEKTLVLPPNKRFYFSVIADDEDSATLYYSWFLNGNCLLGEYSPSLSIEFKKAGKNNITVVISDGENDIAVSWEVIVNSPPEAMVKPGFMSVKIDEEVELKAICNDDGKIVKIIWDLGDGEVLEGNESLITHVYDEEGIYLVELTAVDDMGAEVKAYATIVVKREKEYITTPGFEVIFMLLSIMIIISRRYMFKI